QSYLWELWRRLPPDRFTVLTTPYAGDEAFDGAQPFTVIRDGRRVLFPTPALVRRVGALAAQQGAAAVVLDPALPLGLIGPRLAGPVRPGPPALTAAIAGAGRDRDRLERLVRGSGAPVRLLGRVDDDDLPALYGCADAFAMLARTRWAGLEQEGFGIVFLEAAACAVPHVAGDSGGAAEAVVDDATGVVVRRPGNVDEVTASLARLLDDEGLRRR